MMIIIRFNSCNTIFYCTVSAVLKQTLDTHMFRGLLINGFSLHVATIEFWHGFLEKSINKQGCKSLYTYLEHFIIED